MTFLDFLVMCFGTGVAVAILGLPFVLIVWFFERRKRDRLANWREIGLTPRVTDWQTLLSAESLVGVHRGRSLTMFLSDEPPTYTTIRIHVTSISLLTIAPKWPSSGLFTFFAPSSQSIEDSFSIQSFPPSLAARALALPRLPAILLSRPEPTIRLRAGELRFERPGYFPDLKEAVALFDILCDLADIIEQSPNPPGAS